jgi:hypothetical protein
MIRMGSDRATSTPEGVEACGGIERVEERAHDWLHVEVGFARARDRGDYRAASALPSAVAASVYQWSAPMPGVASSETKGPPEAFLWIPPHCRAVRAVVLGQHNLLEEPLFESKTFRKALSSACIGIVWVTPMFDTVFDFPNEGGDRVDALMQALAKESGYDELSSAPIAPIGHSAAASFPWNFAAWAPERTLALVSLKGDAPLTTLTGSGKPNPEWGARTIDGVPSLMVMGEYEWLEPRLGPALDYQKTHPKALISLYADAGHGHFDLSDDLARYIGLFITKAADARLPGGASRREGVALKSVDPDLGWRADRWRSRGGPIAPAAPAARYLGPRQDSFWYFDRQMARRVEQLYARAAGKQPQLLAFVQDGGVVPQKPGHAQVELAFRPLANGVTFKLQAAYLDRVPDGNPRPQQWTGLPAQAPIGHGKGPISIARQTGPVVQTGPDTWTLAFNRVGFANARRSGDVWFVATQAGDRRYKSAVQQAFLRIPPVNAVGVDQKITFSLPRTLTVKRSGGALRLNGVSDSGLLVRYYVRQGPAEIADAKLRFTAIPHSARRPIKVTVVAWQYGIAGKIKSAPPVEHSIYLSD